MNIQGDIKNLVNDLTKLDESIEENNMDQT